MLFAETHGKLGRDGSNAHDRAEDLLTSTAFQLLRYLPLDAGLLAVLKRVRAVDYSGRVTTALPSWLKLEDVTDAKYDPWPYWGKHGTPDMVVELFAGSRPLGRLVVEVKLDAGKSGAADEDDEETGEEIETDVADADQLRKYWQGLQASGPALGVVYLTAHAVPPADELAASVARPLKGAPPDWLGWLSWRDVWATVRTRDELPARDLTEILAAKGLKGFDGFHAKPITLPPSGRFWTAAPVRWFSRPSLLVPRVSKFWEGKS